MKRAILFVVLCIFGASIAFGQEAQPTTPIKAELVKPAELTEIERLTLQSFLKDFTIAQLQRQVAQRNEDAARTTFWAQVNRLRADKNAPEAEFTFNVQTLRFEPKPAAAGKSESLRDTKKE